jgi:hypothetical protein
MIALEFCKALFATPLLGPMTGQIPEGIAMTDRLAPFEPR